MAIKIFSSREFNQDVGRAKREALSAPVFITDRGKPSHVLLSVKEYRKLTKQKQNIVDLLSMPEASDIDFEPDKLSDSLKTADLS